MVDNGGEFVSRAMDAWAYVHEVQLEFIRPGKPVENAFIESFNGRLGDECLNVHVFVSTTEAQPFLGGACVPRFQPAQCRNYFEHCGYLGATVL